MLRHVKDAASKAKEKSYSTTVLIPFGSLLLAGLGLFGQTATPWWITTLVVFYVIVIALVELIPASIHTYRWLRRWAHRRTIARNYLLSMRGFLTTLVPNLEESRVDTVFNTWKNAQSLDQVPSQVRPDYVHFRTLRSWLNSIDARLEDFRAAL